MTAVFGLLSPEDLLGFGEVGGAGFLQSSSRPVLWRMLINKAFSVIGGP